MSSQDAGCEKKCYNVFWIEFIILTLAVVFSHFDNAVLCIYLVFFVAVSVGGTFFSLSV